MRRHAVPWTVPNFTYIPITFVRDKRSQAVTASRIVDGSVDLPKVPIIGRVVTISPTTSSFSINRPFAETPEMNDIYMDGEARLTRPECTSILHAEYLTAPSNELCKSLH